MVSQVSGKISREFRDFLPGLGWAESGLGLARVAEKSLPRPWRGPDGFALATIPASPKMAYVVPFRALRYDPQRVSLPQVVTQPYDKITPEMQERYYSASANNLVRIILGQRPAGDSGQDNVYTRAASFFQDWRRQSIFLQESRPCLYLYTQRFVFPETKGEYERRGFIGLGRLEDYSAQVVFRHEQTLAKPKADRLDLLRATRAHFEQLFMLYGDPGGELDGLLTVGGAAELEVRDEYGVLHRVWRISDPDVIGLVQAKMRDQKLIIADGHHRYETALSYRDERRAAAAALARGATPSLRVSSPSPMTCRR